MSDKKPDKSLQKAIKDVRDVVMNDMGYDLNWTQIKLEDLSDRVKNMKSQGKYKYYFRYAALMTSKYIYDIYWSEAMRKHMYSKALADKFFCQYIRTRFKEEPDKSDKKNLTVEYIYFNIKKQSTIDLNDD